MPTCQSKIDTILDLSSQIHRSVGDGSLVLEVPDRSHYSRVGEVEENARAVSYIISEEDVGGA